MKTAASVVWQTAGCLAVAVFALVVLVFARSCAAVTDPSLVTAPTPPPKEAPPVVTATAEQIYAYYERNEVKADAALKGQRLILKGKVARIAKDILDTPYVTLQTTALIGQIQCFFRESEVSAIGELAPEQTIRVNGVCKGRIIGNVILEDCRLLKQSEK